ncbi:Protein KIAA0100 [Acanthosepion pharaonis]|uniref:Protein KIAA0100 n=1 Tax=Acanthosepion pharaonis TaxID=158019 RepID=A0A812D066_ACAPH|nr:Protein KIAA0100 [Sepia pharaonis]
MSSSYSLVMTLIHIDDGLIHRPQASWSIRYLTCELSTTQIWLCSVPSATEQFDVPYRAPVEKNVFLSVSRVSYQRADETKQENEEGNSNPNHATPTHMVQVYDMKGAWTRSNRTVLLGLYDGFIKAQTLKRNLSSEALKGFKLDNTRQGYRSKSSSLNTSGNPESPTSPGPIPLSNLHSGHATAMLNKLVSETDKKSVAFTEEPSEANMEQLHGIAACQTDDVVKKNWLIELFNSQVMLKGCETAGYVIVSAAKAQILSCIHKPFWKGRQLCSKTTWVGSLECMQYYATVDPGEVVTDEDIAWLSKENIEDRSEFDLEGLPEMVSSGQSVGGVVNSTVSGQNGSVGQSVQLQRIVSRCRCQFFYAGYGEVESEQLPEVIPMEDLPEMMQMEDGVDTTTVLHHDLNVCTNSLQYTMILDIVNNLLLHVESNRKQASEKLQRMRFQLQLSTVEDQRSPILLLQENVRKQVQKLRLSLSLEQVSLSLEQVSLSLEQVSLSLEQVSLSLEQVSLSLEQVSLSLEQSPFSLEQVSLSLEQVSLSLFFLLKSLFSLSFFLEQSLFLLNKSLSLEQVSFFLEQVSLSLEQVSLSLEQVSFFFLCLSLTPLFYFALFECKEQINGFNEELTIRISCYKEGQVQFKSHLQTTQAYGAQVVRTNEVCFKFAQWRLTESDGQLGIADLVLRNFVYTKVNRDNDTWTHQLELGWVRMTNLLPNPIYKDVLVPRPLGQEGENKQMTLRIVCSERPPVGGIAVKEHFEVNVVPLQIQLTYQFFKAMMVFFFPERNIDIDDQQDAESDDGVPQRRKTDKKGSLKDRGVISSKRNAQSYTSSDDIDKMKERAENNNTFLYIKIPEVSLKVSYKGEKEKNFEDLHDFSLVLPTLEYHNCIWTWFDLLMTMKNDSKRILLAQALRQKFHMRSRAPNEVPLTDVQQEEDKAKMLLGAKLLAGQEKPVKKSLFGKPPK